MCVFCSWSGAQDAELTPPCVSQKKPGCQTLISRHMAAIGVSVAHHFLILTILISSPSFPLWFIKWDIWQNVQASGFLQHKDELWFVLLGFKKVQWKQSTWLVCYIQRLYSLCEAWNSADEKFKSLFINKINPALELTNLICACL